MNENVKNVNDGDFVTIPKDEYYRLQEYRQIALDLRSGVSRMKASLGGALDE